MNQLVVYRARKQHKRFQAAHEGGQEISVLPVRLPPLDIAT